MTRQGKEGARGGGLEGARGRGGQFKGPLATYDRATPQIAHVTAAG